jgi:hypothetical protein
MTNEEGLEAVMKLLQAIISGKLEIPIADLAYIDVLCDEMKFHEQNRTNSDKTLRKIEIFFQDLREREILPPVVH